MLIIINSRWWNSSNSFHNFFTEHTLLLYLKKMESMPTSTKGFPGDSDGKESACSVGDLGLIPGLGRSPGEG